MARYLTEPVGLRDAIHARIAHEETKRDAQQKFLFTMVTGTSLVGTVTSFVFLVQSFAQSGFYNYFTLMLDRAVLVNYWKELSFSLAESFPVLTVAIFLTLSAVCVWSLMKSLQFKKHYFTYGY